MLIVEQVRQISRWIWTTRGRCYWWLVSFAARPIWASSGGQLMLTSRYTTVGRSTRTNSMTSSEWVAVFGRRNVLMCHHILVHFSKLIHIATCLVLLLILVGKTLFKQTLGCDISNRIMLKLGLIILRLNIKYASIDGIWFLIWSHTFQIAAMTSFHVRPPLAAAAASAGCSLARRARVTSQFLIHSTFILVSPDLFAVVKCELDYLFNNAVRTGNISFNQSFQSFNQSINQSISLNLVCVT